MGNPVVEGASTLASVIYQGIKDAAASGSKTAQEFLKDPTMFQAAVESGSLLGKIIGEVENPNTAPLKIVELITRDVFAIGLGGLTEALAKSTYFNPAIAYGAGILVEEAYKIAWDTANEWSRNHNLIPEDNPFFNLPPSTPFYPADPGRQWARNEP